MKFQMYIDVVLKDKNGKVIKHSRKKVHSYVQQLIDILNAAFSAANQTFTDTGGVSRTALTGSNILAINAGVAVSAWGIVVGTGTNAVTISQYALQTQIANGSAAGQLNYGAVSVGASTTVGSTRQFTVARTFTNNSGASITVNEVGLYCEAWDGSAYHYGMLERSLLTFSIANGASATVTYTISVTV